MLAPLAAGVAPAVAARQGQRGPSCDYTSPYAGAGRPARVRGLRDRRYAPPQRVARGPGRQLPGLQAPAKRVPVGSCTLAAENKHLSFPLRVAGS